MCTSIKYTFDTFSPGLISVITIILITLYFTWLFSVNLFILLISTSFCVCESVCVTLSAESRSIREVFTRHPASGTPAIESILGCHTACYCGMILNTLSTYLSIFHPALSLYFIPLSVPPTLQLFISSLSQSTPCSVWDLGIKSVRQSDKPTDNPINCIP